MQLEDSSIDRSYHTGRSVASPTVIRQLQAMDGERSMYCILYPCTGTIMQLLLIIRLHARTHTRLVILHNDANRSASFFLLLPCSCIPDRHLVRSTRKTLELRSPHPDLLPDQSFNQQAKYFIIHVTEFFRGLVVSDGGC